MRRGYGGGGGGGGGGGRRRRRRRRRRGREGGNWVNSRGLRVGGIDG
jgi:hypothetical protein